jgi:glutathione-regulated potassium-efflux system ancillary protein KefC
LLGSSEQSAQRTGELFHHHDNQNLQKLADTWGDDKQYGIAVRQHLQDLQQVLENDKIEQEKLNTCHGENCEDHK